MSYFKSLRMPWSTLITLEPYSPSSTLPLLRFEQMKLFQKSLFCSPSARIWCQGPASLSSESMSTQSCLAGTLVTLHVKLWRNWSPLKKKNREIQAPSTSSPLLGRYKVEPPHTWLCSGKVLSPRPAHPSWNKVFRTWNSKQQLLGAMRPWAGTGLCSWGQHPYPTSTG